MAERRREGEKERRREGEKESKERRTKGGMMVLYGYCKVARIAI